MCEVYHARDVSLAREVAVKIFQGEVASDSELGCADSSRRPSRQRMLSHPNIWLATFGIRKGSVPSSQEHAAVLWRGLVRRKRMSYVVSLTDKQNVVTQILFSQPDDHCGLIAYSHHCPMGNHFWRASNQHRPKPSERRN